MKTSIDKGKLYAKRADLIEWDKNKEMRFIENRDLEKLRQNVKERGQLVPLLVNSGKHWGQEGLILSGNFRWKVYGEKGIDVQDVWIELVDCKDEKDALIISSIANAHYGRYNPDKTMELLNPYMDDPRVKSLIFNFSSSISTDSLLQSYGPGNDAVETGQDQPKTLDKNDYNEAAVKQIVLYLQNEAYIDALQRIDVVMAKESLTNNTDVFLFLLKFYEDNISKVS